MPMPDWYANYLRGLPSDMLKELRAYFRDQAYGDEAPYDELEIIDIEMERRKELGI